MASLKAKLIATTTQTVEIELKPALKRKLLAELAVYQGIAAQLEALEAKKDASKALLGELVIESGEEKLSIEGFKTAMVFPVRKKLNKKLFVQQGGTLAQLENATESTPSSPYLLVTCPGQKERTYEQE